jgi:hypothetical protein
MLVMWYIGWCVLWIKISPSREGTVSSDEAPFSHEKPDDGIDNTSVPLSAVLSHISGRHDEPPSSFVANDDGRLFSGSTVEDYDLVGGIDNGAGPAVMQDTGQELEGGQGKRRQVANQKYKAFWRYDPNRDSDDDP